MANPQQSEQRFLQHLSRGAMGAAIVVALLVAWQLVAVGSRITVLFRGNIDRLPVFARLLSKMPAAMFWIVALLIAVACVLVQLRSWSGATRTCFFLFVLFLSLAAYYASNAVVLWTLAAPMTGLVK